VVQLAGHCRPRSTTTNFSYAILPSFSAWEGGNMGTELKVGIHNRVGEKVGESQMNLKSGQLVYWGDKVPKYEDSLSGDTFSLQVHDRTQDFDIMGTTINVCLNRKGEGQVLAMSEESFGLGKHIDIVLPPPGSEEWQPFILEEVVIYRGNK